MSRRFVMLAMKLTYSVSYPDPLQQIPMYTAVSAYAYRVLDAGSTFDVISASYNTYSGLRTLLTAIALEMTHEVWVT